MSMPASLATLGQQYPGHAAYAAKLAAAARGMLSIVQGAVTAAARSAAALTRPLHPAIQILEILHRLPQGHELLKPHAANVHDICIQVITQVSAAAADAHAQAGGAAAAAPGGCAQPAAASGVPGLTPCAPVPCRDAAGATTATTGIMCSCPHQLHRTWPSWTLPCPPPPDLTCSVPLPPCRTARRTGWCARSCCWTCTRRTRASWTSRPPRSWSSSARWGEEEKRSSRGVLWCAV